MSTFIDGIGQCQVVDKSGELLDLKGHDITSLPKTGTFTWEHQANSPATLVGKILKAKKIFCRDDCENGRELYYWNKCKSPYLYVMGELLDDYTASARECAGQMRYSKDHPDKQPLLGFSIEGSELPGTRKGMVITRSIARKVTLTQSPCNSACIAEIFEAPEQKSQIKDDFDSIFKSKEEASNLFKSGEGEKIYETFLAKKELEAARPPSKGGKAPKSPEAEYEGQGIHAGRNKSGKPVFSHGSSSSYKFNPAEHQHHGEHHKSPKVHSQNPKLGVNKESRREMHSNAVASSGRVENRAALSLENKDKIAQEQGKQVSHMAKSEPKSGLPSGWKSSVTQHPKLGSIVSMSHPEHGIVSVHKPAGSNNFEVSHAGKNAGLMGKKGVFDNHKDAILHAQKYTHALHQGKVLGRNIVNTSSGPNLGKSLEAGNTNAAPSTLTNGAAYQVENMGSKTATTGAEDHKFNGTKKKDWNKRAKEEYEKWPHKEKFEKFMQARMPHLAMGEIKALGRALALKKSIDFEKSLEALVIKK